MFNIHLKGKNGQNLIELGIYYIILEGAKTRPSMNLRFFGTSFLKVKDL